MAKRPRKSDRSQTEVQDLVVVMVTEDMEEAKDREALLKNNDIPAVIRQQSEDSAGLGGYAVMVPEEYLDEAHVVIESQDAYDDFYDFALEDEDETDLGGDIFDEQF